MLLASLGSLSMILERRVLVQPSPFQTAVDLNVSERAGMRLCAR